MGFKQLTGTETSTSMINAWLGYNQNHRVTDGEMHSMKNMTSDFFPLLSPRDKRGLVAELTDCTALDASDSLYWADDNKFYFNTRYICDLTNATKHQFVRMGAYVVIFPDKKAYNTYTDTLINLESEYTSTTNPTLCLCKMDGTVYDSSHLWINDTAPSDKTTYPNWLDTSTTPSVLKVWSVNESQWASVPTTYVEITAPNLGTYFKEDDAVDISGCDVEDFNTSMIIVSKTTNSIVVTGLLDDGAITNTKPMKFKRSVPDMDFVCEKNNRLYGCSSTNHEVYASKLGDPTNWNYFGGLSSDSYAATVGTDGNFTGCIAHLGYVLFFKERGVHKMYGDMPSNYSINYTELRGVQEGSERSLVVLNEYLYYKSSTGVCVYDGSLPTDISENFGTNQYFDAVAGSFKDKYYISMRDRDYKWYLFVYDTRKQLWHMEDNIKAAGFATYENGLYMVDQYQNMWAFPLESQYTTLFPDMTWDDTYYYPSASLYPDFSTECVFEDDVKWEAETGDFGLDNPYEKYVSKLILRLWMDEEAEISIEIQYDSNGEWEELFNYVADCKRSFNIPLRVTRCDHYKLKFSGIGAVKIYSLAQVIETGSEL